MCIIALNAARRADPLDGLEGMDVANRPAAADKCPREIDDPRTAPRAGSFPLPRGMVPQASPTDARALKGPSPPQRCLPPARSLEVPAVPRRSAARHPLPHFHFRAPSSGNGAIDLAERKLRAGKGLEGPDRAAHAHSLAVPSSEPVANLRPSGLAATERTAAVWP